MSRRERPRRRTDPRRIPGSMAGPGGPHDVGGVVLDATHAVILETVDVSTVDPERGARGRPGVLALVLGGRVNQTQDRASVLFLLDSDGAAAIVTELIALYWRAGVNPLRFMQDVEARFRQLGKEGNLS